MFGLLPRLLLVEDNEDDEFLTLRALKPLANGLVVTILRTGSEAIDYFTGDYDVPKLVLLDFNLPQANGLQVLQHIKSLPKTVHVPVVIFSSLMSEGMLQRCYAAGASSCATKPVMPEEYMLQVALIVDYWLHINEPYVLSGALHSKSMLRGIVGEA